MGSATLVGAFEAWPGNSLPMIRMRAFGSKNCESGPGVLAADVGAVENPAEELDESELLNSLAYERDEASETQDIEAWPPLLYDDDGTRPSFARDGEDDILCKLCSIRLRPLSFGGCSKGKGSAYVIVGVITPGDSVMLSEVI